VGVGERDEHRAKSDPGWDSQTFGSKDACGKHSLDGMHTSGGVGWQRGPSKVTSIVIGSRVAL
jgi:hypothetical protein